MSPAKRSAFREAPVPNLLKQRGYKPDSARAWRGRSYRKGGERVRDLRDQETLKDRSVR